MKPIDYLNEHKLKRTSCREGIIQTIISANHPLSESEIREQLAGNYDRTTFYRSFKTLEEHQIVHRIIIDNQTVKYALAQQLSAEEHHPHFFCNCCQSVQCITTVPVQKIPLPDGYSASETSVIIKGICASCKDKI